MPASACSPGPLDYLIRAAAIHTMTGDTFRALGLRGEHIAAVSADPAGLNDLAGPGTMRVDADGLTLLPAFADAHEHLMEASRNTLLVPVDQAASIAEFRNLISEAARQAAPGQWIVTSMAWHESNLAENRMPTLAELDEAAPAHPVLSRRGGHLAVANSLALRAAGISAGAPDPPGGKIGRRTDGELSGLLEGAAVYRVSAQAPPPSTSELASALGVGSARYAALGVGTVREAMVTMDELLAYREAWERRLLRVRVRPLVRVGPEMSADDVAALLRDLDSWKDFGDDWLRIWGVKLVMDGGVEGGALEQPYANDSSNYGHLNWELPRITAVCADALRHGWRVGTHAAGDRAVRVLLDVYEQVAGQAEVAPPWTLVIEHALLSNKKQRERSARGGFGVTVQHTLLWNMGSEMIEAWGPERTSRVNPLDDWLAAGASLAVGTDITRPFNPMTNVFGMATRATRSAGIQGREHAIDVATALRLYTLGTAELNGEADRLGSISAGKLADVVAYPLDPVTADPEYLSDLKPAFTIIGGRPAFDPDGRLSG